MSFYRFLESVKDVVDQVYEYVHQEESIGEVVTDLFYSVQTGAPQYILHHFCWRDLKEFMSNFHADAYFVLVRRSGMTSKLNFSLAFKQGEEWRVSFLLPDRGRMELPLLHYLLQDSGSVLLLPQPKSGSSDMPLSWSTSSSVIPKEETLLLLRPTSTALNGSKIRKMISVYDPAAWDGVSESEYIFSYLLHRPEYVDRGMFQLILQKFAQCLDAVLEEEASNFCKKISVLWDSEFRVYRVHLILD